MTDMVSHKLLQKIPKVELHLHLDCSLSYELVKQIDERITYYQYLSEFVAPMKCGNLKQLLDCTLSSIQLMQEEKNIRLIIVDLFNQLQRENVIYAEIRFAPLLHTKAKLNLHKVVEVVIDETVKCIDNTGIQVNLILCTLRHFTKNESLSTVKLCNDFINDRIRIGFDLAGDEAGYSLNNHIQAFEYAAENDIPRTAHAGEAAGAESIWETIKTINPIRIGHGVRCTEDPDLVQFLKENHIHLEISPSCNVQTNIYDEFRDHVIDELYRKGLSVGINTDARTLGNTSLTMEYDKIIQCFEWKLDDLLECNLNAIDASFAGEDTKIEIRSKLIEKYGEA